MTETPVAFVCVNVGPRYPMEYVEILRDMTLRNCTRMERDCAWFCITDRPAELPDDVYPIAADPALPGYWQKVRLFSPDMPWDEGTRVVYFDLDVAITGRLEELVETPGISQDVGWPCYNSSVMVWDHGQHREVWERFRPEIMSAPGNVVPQKLLPAGTVNGGDQEYLTEVGGWETFPEGWCVSYRWQAQDWPPNGSKVVQFHGPTKPHEVTGGWVPNIWRVNGFTSFPEFKGANTSEDDRLANVASAVQREHLPWFTGFGDEGLSCVIVGGGPSMLEHISDIRWHARQRKTRVVALNNAWRVLVKHGVTPFATVMLDARAENAEFVKDAPPGMRLLLCSQCHPAVFDAAEANGSEIAVWHSAHSDNARLLEILKPWWDDGPKQKPTLLVPGGSTVGLRTIWLAAYSGFRRLYMYGVDGSYSADGAHHAYPQALNDGEDVLEVQMGPKTYRCAPWMVRQSEEFRWTWADMREFQMTPDSPVTPVSIFVRGTGLIPDIARDLREEDRAK